MTILNLYRQLNERDKIKIEGILELKISEYKDLKSIPLIIMKIKWFKHT